MEVCINEVFIFSVESLLVVLKGDFIGIFLEALKEIFINVLKGIL